MADGIDDVLRLEREKLELKDGEQPDALCLSGGGIRSASFNLGVLQALAESGLLTRFHYLSTVSGGGYIGGWLQTLIAEKNGNATQAQDELKGANGSDSALGRLRRVTNFLAPDPSPTSADSFAGIALYLRNMLLNWLLLLPLLLALTLPPILARTFVWQTHVSKLSWLVVALACALGVWIAARAAVALPSHLGGRQGDNDAAVWRWIILPFMAWTLLMAAGIVGKPGCGWPSPGEIVVPTTSCQPPRQSTMFLGWWGVPWIAYAHFAALVIGYFAALIYLIVTNGGHRNCSSRTFRAG
jgi:hypothetical protein